MSFFDLPAEVRQRVYSYVFGHGVAEPLMHRGLLKTVVGVTPDERSAQLLSVSKAVASEASAIFSEQTIVVLGRQFPATQYLAINITYRRAPKPESIRHLKIDINPNDIEDIDIDDIEYLDLPNIKNISLSCFALCWASRYPAGIEADTVYSYDDIVKWLRKLAMVFLAHTSLSLMEEKSVIGKKVVIELSSIKGGLMDTRVSYRRQPTSVSRLTRTQVPMKVIRLPA